MATQIFFGWANPYESGLGAWLSWQQYTKLNGSASGFQGVGMRSTRGASVRAVAASTVAGPTSGIELTDSSSFPWYWVTRPISADVTISGTITLNVWSHESSMSANTAINVVIYRCAADTGTLTQIAKSTRTTELGTASAVANFTVTPTSTDMTKGDRLVIAIFGDDAGTMATGFTFTGSVDGSTAAANGDSYISLTETLSFISAYPSPGSTLYLTDTAGPAVGANDEKEMWTARGGGVQTAATTSTASWTPLQYTKTAGGTSIEWYSKPLNAFTLSGTVQANLRFGSSVSGNCHMAELAVCNEDGSSAVIWAMNLATTWVESGGSGFGSLGYINGAEQAYLFPLTGKDTSVTNGQRLRLRCYVTGQTNAPTASRTETLYYAGTSAAASGDSYIILEQSVTEYVAAVVPRNPAINHQNPGIL